MKEIWILAILITVFFSIVKFMEMKYMEDEIKPLKYFIRDSIFVMGASVLAAFLYFQTKAPIDDFFSVIAPDTIDKAAVLGEATIFTDEPGF